MLNLKTGKLVFQRNAQNALQPASNQKLAVTLAALDELGPRFRIPTRVYGEGNQDGATWRGRLVVKGYGDPTLSREDLKKLVREVKSRGIRRVTGRIVADESFFDTRRTAPGWKPSYYKEECPPLTALIVARGVKSGRVVTDPALMTAKAFRTALETAGVDVMRGVTKAAVKPTAARLADVYSPPIMGLVKRMNLVSDNFIAEMLLKELGARSGSAGSTAAGAFVARRVLKERSVPLDGVRLRDGSGLSRFNRWTARGLAVLLRSAWSDAAISPMFVDSLPVAGRTGTLADRMESAARARRGAREDRHDERRLRALRLRAAAVRLLHPPERLTRSHDGCAPQPGPLRADPRGRRLAAQQGGERGLVEDLDALFLRLGELRPRRLARHDPVVFFETELATFAPFASSAAVASSRVQPSSVPVITYVEPVSGPSTGRSASPASNVSPRSRSSATSRWFASSENHSAIASARSGPIPSTSRISSWPASMSASTVPKWRARFCAVTQPTSGMLSPKRTRKNGWDFDCSIASTVFAAEISANPSNPASSSASIR